MRSTLNRIRICWTKSVTGQYFGGNLITEGKIKDIDTKGIFQTLAPDNGGGGGGTSPYNPTLGRDVYMDGEYRADCTAAMVDPGR